MNDIATQDANPFGAVQPAVGRASVAPAQTDQQRVIAEVQAAMMIARLNPRDPRQAMDRILNACARPTLAEVAVYQFSRGGTDVCGPSIRLAEAIAQQWGNIKTSVRELDQGGGSSTVQAVAWDLETGYQCDKVFHVPHVRYARSGTKRLEDPRDIYEAVANQGARRLRACILAVIPGDVVEAAVKQCEATMKARVEITPEFIATLLERFAEFGVTKEQIEKRLQRRIDTMSPAQAVQLKKIHTSLRDGMSGPGDWFEAAEGAAAAATKPAGRTLHDIKTGKGKPAAPMPEPSPPAFDAEAFAARLDAALDPDALDQLADELRDAPTDDDTRGMLQDMCQRLRAQLQG